MPFQNEAQRVSGTLEPRKKGPGTKCGAGSFKYA